MRLSWSVAQGPFDSFVVQYEDTNGQPQALLVDGDQSKILISGLEPSTPYRFLLYGLHEGKRLGPLSAEGTTGPAPAGQTSGEPGPRLSQLSVTDVTTSSLRLNWEAPPGAFDSFLLRFGVPSPSTLEPHPRPLLQRELMVPGTRHSAVLRDLRPGTLYSLTLYGLRGPHKADSIQGTARTLSPVLESPRDLQFSEIRETSAKVNWMPPPSRADSFKVSYQLADGGEPQSVQVDGRARTQKLQGLIPGARYEVTVVSVRGFEESEPLTVPDGPTQLCTELDRGFAVLHWKPPRIPLDSGRGWRGRREAPGSAPASPSPTGRALGDLEARNFDTLVAGPRYLLPGGVTSHQLLASFLHPLQCTAPAMWVGESLLPPVSTSFTTGLEKDWPLLSSPQVAALNVFCDMETDGGGWLLMVPQLASQRRMDGQTDFWRDWEDYAHGFGKHLWGFWLGNEALHSLTQAGDYSMRVDLAAGDEAVFPVRLLPRRLGCGVLRLHLEGYHGTAGKEALMAPSSPLPRGLHELPQRQCLLWAWWYRNCHYANLNGLYGSTVDHQWSWYYWKGFEFSVPFTGNEARAKKLSLPSRGG
uniref:Uncharacterized protein n=1 Tax=Macaca nemestrina TaxID=9545 RepID=A0A2K6BMF4_MACNE